MGKTAENVAHKYKISREKQDEFAYQSQQKAKVATEKGYFKNQSVPAHFLQKLDKRQEDFFDEHIRGDIALGSLKKLQPVFEKNGSVTAGNASGINDGAAFILLASETFLKKNNVEPLAKIIGWAHSGLSPEYMGVGPISAVKKLLAKTKNKLEDFDLIESNEAFAATSIAVNQELGLEIEKVNVNGGAIALGHPIGASGSRILTDLLYELRRREKKNWYSNYVHWRWNGYCCWSRGLLENILPKILLLVKNSI